MDLLLWILLIIYVVSVIAEIIVEKRKDELLKELIKENTDLAKVPANIEAILILAEAKKENYMTTINKIKEVITSDQTIK